MKAESHSYFKSTWTWIALSRVAKSLSRLRTSPCMWSHLCTSSSRQRILSPFGSYRSGCSKVESLILRPEVACFSQNEIGSYSKFPCLGSIGPQNAYRLAPLAHRPLQSESVEISPQNHTYSKSCIDSRRKDSIEHYVSGIRLSGTWSEVCFRDCSHQNLWTWQGFSDW